MESESRGPNDEDIEMRGSLPRWESLEGDVLVGSDLFEEVEEREFLIDASSSLEVDEVDEASWSNKKIKRKRSEEIEFAGDVFCLNDVKVDGRVYGRLATATRRQDWAEWFECEDEPSLMAGATVVRLKSPEQKLTLNTNGAGPILVVSERAAVAAGVPFEAKEASKGRLVCFMGQVPVRCKPPISVGEQLLPSGLNDGTAIGLQTYLKKRGTRQDKALLDDPLGVAMEPLTADISNTEGEVLALVRWDHAVRREVAFLVDQEEMRIRGRCEQCFIALLAAIATLSIILHVITLLLLIAYFLIRSPLAPTSRNNNNHSRDDYKDGSYNSMSTACAVWVIQFFLVVIFFLHFSSRRIRHGGHIACFWIGHAFFAALYGVIMLSKNENDSDHNDENEDHNPLLGASLALVLAIITLYDLVYQCTLLTMLHSFNHWNISSLCCCFFCCSCCSCTSSRKKDDDDNNKSHSLLLPHQRQQGQEAASAASREPQSTSSLSQQEAEV